jgi:hypothetical protein
LIVATLALIAALASAAVPTATTGSASSIDETAATLNGTVNPEGALLEECIFEYGTTTAYGQSQACDLTPAEIGEGSAPVAVKADLTGLSGATTYHFRLVAKNAEGTSNGLDESFKTLSPPVIEAFATDVAYSEATLNAAINPEGFATTYRFQWGPTTAYGSETAAADAGSDSAVHEFSHALSGLSEGATYHYRVVATNSIGTASSPDHTLTTYAHVPRDTDCPNQAFRVGPSAGLPDCRAYEMVSPVEKNGGEIGTVTPGAERREINQASTDGNRYIFSSPANFAGSEAALFTSQYLAIREGDGWATKPITPRRGSVWPEFAPKFVDISSQFKAFTDDLSQGWFVARTKQPLTPNGLTGNHYNVYGVNLEDGGLTALTTEPSPPGGVAVVEDVYGHSEDGSHLVFGGGPLTPDAAPEVELITYGEVYDYSGGQLHLVSVLPNGEADPRLSRVGAGWFVSDAGRRRVDHAVSDDGSRIFWVSADAFQAEVGTLYVRIDGQETRKVSAAEQAYFWTASADGSTAVYGEAIDGESNGLKNQRLYEFDVESETRSLIASEVRGVVGASDDLSYLYFVSRENLAPGATAGEENLYLRHAGSISLIATLAGADVGNISNQEGYPDIASLLPRNRTTRVTGDGRHLAFMSSKSLTGYDNTDANSGKADFEVYLYDAETDQLICASCNPSGARPVGHVVMRPFSNEPQPVSPERWAAAWLPSSENSLYSSRVLSEDGSRVFFNSYDSLDPRDTNGKQDVYQWEEQGSGSCERPSGCISLLSTGHSLEDSEVLDATPDGGGVFIKTTSGLDPRDNYGRDVYDARVGGGYPPPPPPPPPCAGDSCQSVPAPPVAATPASASFRGAGDPLARKRKARTCRARRHRAAKHGHRAKRARACRAAKRRGR